MEVSKLTIENNEQPTLTKGEIAKRRYQRLMELTNEDWQRFTSRRDIALAVGILNEAKGQQYVFRQIQKGAIIEEKRPGEKPAYFLGKTHELFSKKKNLLGKTYSVGKDKKPEIALPAGHPSIRTIPAPSKPIDNELRLVLRKGDGEVALTFNEVRKFIDLFKKDGGCHTAVNVEKTGGEDA